MGRQQKLTDRQFLRAYKKAKSITDLAIALGVTTMTVRNYLKSSQLEAPKKKSNGASKLQLQIFKHYRGLRTIRSLAEQFDIPVRTVRYLLQKQLTSWYQTAPPKWAVPFKLAQIKIVKELVEAEEMGDYALWDDPSRLASSVGSTYELIREYQDYAFEMMSSKPKSGGKSNASRNRKR